MRIAFYAPMKSPGDAVPSGDQHFARVLVAALERGGAVVDLASGFSTYDRGDPARQRRLQALGGGLADRLVARYRREGAMRPDAWFTYHLYHKAPDHLGPHVAASLGIPYAVAEASHAPKQAGGVWDIGHRAAERAIRAADRIYSINPVDPACLVPLVRGEDVLKDLPPFIDTAPFRRTPEERRSARLAVAAEFGFDPAAPLILTVAMMRDDQKLASYRVLADALSRLGRRDWRLLVVGDGPAMGKVRDAMRPFHERVSLAGLQKGSGLLDAYAAADIFAWPAVKEAVGLAFIEAAAAGLAIAAGRSGGIEAIVEDGRTGIVVPAGDAGAMSAALARLLDAPELVRSMGERAGRRAQAINDIAAASSLLAGDLKYLTSRHSKLGVS